MGEDGYVDASQSDGVVTILMKSKLYSNTNIEQERFGTDMEKTMEKIVAWRRQEVLYIPVPRFTEAWQIHGITVTLA